jgi:hypothetical protein
MGPLFLRNKADVDVLLNVVADHGLAMTRDALRLTYWRCSESRHFEPAVADESVASDLRDIHRPALDRRASGFCDG